MQITNVYLHKFTDWKSVKSIFTLETLNKIPESEPEHVYAVGKEYIQSEASFIKIFICYSVNNTWYATNGVFQTCWPNSNNKDQKIRFEVGKFNPITGPTVQPLALTESENFAWIMWLKTVESSKKKTAEQLYTEHTIHLNLAKQLYSNLCSFIPASYSDDKVAFFVWNLLTIKLVENKWQKKNLSSMIDYFYKPLDTTKRNVFVRTSRKIIDKLWVWVHEI